MHDVSYGSILEVFAVVISLTLSPLKADTSGKGRLIILALPFALAGCKSLSIALDVLEALSYQPCQSGSAQIYVDYDISWAI